MNRILIPLVIVAALVAAPSADAKQHASTARIRQLERQVHGDRQSIRDLRRMVAALSGQVAALSKRTTVVERQSAEALNVAESVGWCLLWAPAGTADAVDAAGDPVSVVTRPVGSPTHPVTEFAAYLDPQCIKGRAMLGEDRNPGGPTKPPTSPGPDVPPKPQGG